MWNKIKQPHEYDTVLIIVCSQLKEQLHFCQDKHSELYDSCEASLRNKLLFGGDRDVKKWWQQDKSGGCWNNSVVTTTCVIVFSSFCRGNILGDTCGKHLIFSSFCSLLHSAMFNLIPAIQTWLCLLLLGTKTPPELPKNQQQHSAEMFSSHLVSFPASWVGCVCSNEILQFHFLCLPSITLNYDRFL